MLFIVYFISIFSEHKGTKNPAQFDMNGKVFVVKDSKGSETLQTKGKLLSVW